MADTFSTRFGLRPAGSPVFDDAPEELRFGSRELLTDLGFKGPWAQRRLICLALRIQPDPDNWSEYPNIDDEVNSILAGIRWPKVYDLIERIPKFLADDAGTLQPDLSKRYRALANSLLADVQSGYRFVGPALQRLGTDDFDRSLQHATALLADARFAEARRQLARAIELRNQIPGDWSNATKEAVNSVEGLLQILFGREGVALPAILTDNLSNLPRGVKRMFDGLYSLGTATTGARHAGIGGPEPTAARAELAIHLASALHTYVLEELQPSAPRS